MRRSARIAGPLQSDEFSVAWYRTAPPYRRRQLELHVTMQGSNAGETNDESKEQAFLGKTEKNSRAAENGSSWIVRHRLEPVRGCGE